jgi:uncharacterized protein with FMN-binding domain/DMSO/TMAO reductase YedYZ heme-binding membrane subunit
MILLLSLAVTCVFVLLCAKPLKARPAPFYLAAALIAGLVVGLHWTAALPSAVRSYPATVVGALGTAAFILVMVVGAFPNGHPFVKRVMPIRGELSILACLLTLGHNLSYGKRYLTPGYLFSSPITPTKVAGWVSVVSIALMLVLTVTSIKAVRRRFQPQAWKALQRWAYVFYALVYLHVLLMTIPNILRGREPYKYMVNLLVYSVIYLGYAICRVRKGVLQKRRQWGKVTPRSQLAAAGVGAVLSLLLLGGVALSTPSQASEPAAVAAVETSQLPETSPSADFEQLVELAPEAEVETAQKPEGETSETTTDQPSAEPEQTADAAPETETSSPAAVSPSPTPSAATAEVTAAPATSAATASEPVSEPVSTPAPETAPESSPAPQSKYRDGTYTGSAPGYVGTVTVAVTISNDRITSVAVTKHEDDPEYMEDAQSGVISAILAAQSADVSAVTGATFSSEGIMDAVKAALAQAAN